MSRRLKYIFLGALVFRLVLSFVSWHPDVNNHIDWGIRFFEYGAKGFYAPDANVWSYTWPNQPPGTILIFAFIRKLFEFVFGMFWWVNVNVPPFPSGVVTFLESNLYAALLQWPGVLADLGIAYLIYKLGQGKKWGELGAVLFLINPVIWYNSAVWGQTDATVNFFGLLAFYLLLKNKPVRAITAFAVSLYIKLSLLIFAPIFLILLVKKYCTRDIVKYTLPALALVWLATLVFTPNGQEPFSWLFNVYTHKVLSQQLHVITANAFNIWAGLTGIHEQPNSLMAGPLSYANWGILVFVIFFVPILYSVWKKQDEKTVIVALAMTGFSVWMLLTNMHERYLYPLLPYFTILAVQHKRLLPIYWAVSGVSLLNLYNFWFTPRIGPVVKFLSFGDRLMPRVLGFANFGIFLILYKKFYVKVKN